MSTRKRSRSKKLQTHGMECGPNTAAQSSPRRSCRHKQPSSITSPEKQTIREANKQTNKQAEAYNTTANAMYGRLPEFGITFRRLDCGYSLHNNKRHATTNLSSRAGSRREENGPPQPQHKRQSPALASMQQTINIKLNKLFSRKQRRVPSFRLLRELSSGNP